VRLTRLVHARSGEHAARVRFRGERPAFLLPTCTTAEAADERAKLLAELAVKLGIAEHVHADVARGILERAAQRDGKALAGVGPMPANNNALQQLRSQGHASDLTIDLTRVRSQCFM